MIVRFLFFIIVISMLQAINTFGQNVVFYPKNSIYDPVVVIQCDNATFLQMKDSVDLNKDRVIPSFLLINCSKLTNYNIRDTVNYFLNTRQLDVHKVFLIIVGNEHLFKRQRDFYDIIYADKFYISTDGTETNDRAYHVTPFNEFNFNKTANQFLKYQLWETDLSKIKEKTVKEFRRKKTSIELGLGFTKVFLNGIHTPYDIPSNISVFQIQINKMLGKNYKLMSDIGIGMNMPSKKDGVTMETSFVGEDYSLMGSSIFTWSVNIAKFLKPKDSLYPFVAIGISKSNLMLMYSNNHSSQMSVKPEMFNYGSLSFTTGAELRFSERINMDIKVSYHVSLNTGAKINNFNASAGVNINLQKKIKYYYQYLRLK